MRDTASGCTSLLLALALAGPAPAQTQDAPPGFAAPEGGTLEFPLARPRTPLLTLDQERVFTDSRFGRRVAAELNAASEELARQNRLIEAELTAEERALTERRAALPPDEFRALADAFDEKVVGFRRAQDRKARAFQRRDEAERQVFLRAALPVLADLVAELGAVAILDDRAVLFAAQSIDVTDRAIARIDSVIGAGMSLSPPGPILPEDSNYPVPALSPSEDTGPEDVGPEDAGPEETVPGESAPGEAAPGETGGTAPTGAPQ
ncbi:MAG: OmpH family outer membrane protein [Pseudomonadota bacterium]